MTHDIAKTTRAVKAEYPPEARTARHMLVLLEATRQATARSWEAAKGRPLSGEPERQRRQVLRELQRLRVRLDGYAAALSKVAPTDPMPPEAQRLFFIVPWEPGMPPNLRHPMPDFATPFKLDNQYEQLEQFYSFQWDEFFRYLGEGLEDVADAASKAAAKAGEVVGEAASSAAPWLLGGLGVLVAGGITYAVVSRRGEGPQR